ncbi:MAG: glycosyltransferase family A protein [Thermodesulfobacteriota bacterium]|nr:glycosyltransferase family A protein [Thermodesulfobacteriota bacterium]
MQNLKHPVQNIRNKNASPLVSVIIPTFNRGWIIAEAVQSVLDQTYQPLEIIVVDDGSTDNTRDVLEPFMDRIILLKQENKGVSAARNLGIQNTRGEFIAFLDSDDLWLPDKTACQIDFFKASPNAIICQTEEIWIRKGRRVNPKKKHKKPSGMIFEPSLHLCLVSPSAVMMHHSFFDIIGLFDECLAACEDYDLWLRTSLAYPVFLIERPCIVKRGGHSDQLSGMHSLDRFRIQSIKKMLSSGKLSETQKKEALTVLKKKSISTIKAALNETNIPYNPHDAQHHNKP